MVSDRALSLLNTLHRGVLRLSRGRLGWRALGMEMLELTTTGRRSGEPRSIMLSSPLIRDGAVLVVASRGGDERHPAWYLNLVAKPDAEVTLRGEARRMRARVTGPEERAALWPAVARAYPGYAAYQRRTSRVIPLVWLEPRG